MSYHGKNTHCRFSDMNAQQDIAGSFCSFKILLLLSRLFFTFAGDHCFYRSISTSWRKIRKYENICSGILLISIRLFVIFSIICVYVIARSLIVCTCRAVGRPKILFDISFSLNKFLKDFLLLSFISCYNI